MSKRSPALEPTPEEDALYKAIDEASTEPSVDEIKWARDIIANLRWLGFDVVRLESEP